mgnify:CR=1 FL=1
MLIIAISVSTPFAFCKLMTYQEAKTKLKETNSKWLVSFFYLKYNLIIYKIKIKYVLLFFNKFLWTI